MNPNFIKRHPLTQILHDNTLTTILPTGMGTNGSLTNQIVIMVSIIDSLGAITNVTGSVTVVPQSSVASSSSANIDTYNTALNTVIAYQNVSISTDDESRIYSVIANDINLYQALINAGTQTQQYNNYQFKQTLISRLLVLKGTSYTSALDEVITDGLKQLMTGNQVQAVSLSATQIGSTVSNFASYFMTQISSLAAMTQNYISNFTAQSSTQQKQIQSLQSTLYNGFQI